MSCMAHASQWAAMQRTLSLKAAVLQENTRHEHHRSFWQMRLPNSTTPIVHNNTAQALTVCCADPGERATLAGNVGLAQAARRHAHRNSPGLALCCDGTARQRASDRDAAALGDHQLSRCQLGDGAGLRASACGDRLRLADDGGRAGALAPADDLVTDACRSFSHDALMPAHRSVTYACRAFGS